MKKTFFAILSLVIVLTSCTNDINHKSAKQIQQEFSDSLNIFSLTNKYDTMDLSYLHNFFLQKMPLAYPMATLLDHIGFSIRHSNNKTEYALRIPCFDHIHGSDKYYNYYKYYYSDSPRDYEEISLDYINIKFNMPEVTVGKLVPGIYSSLEKLYTGQYAIAQMDTTDRSIFNTYICCSTLTGDFPNQEPYPLYIQIDEPTPEHYDIQMWLYCASVDHYLYIVDRDLQVIPINQVTVYGEYGENYALLPTYYINEWKY